MKAAGIIKLAPKATIVEARSTLEEAEDQRVQPGTLESKMTKSPKTISTMAKTWFKSSTKPTVRLKPN